MKAAVSAPIFDEIQSLGLFMKNAVLSDCQGQVLNSSSSTPLWVPDRNALFLRDAEDTQMLLKPNGHCSRGQGAELSKNQVCFSWQLQE